MPIAKLVLRILLASAILVGPQPLSSAEQSVGARPVTLQANFEQPVSASRNTRFMVSVPYRRETGDAADTDRWLKLLVVAALVGYQLRRKHRFLSTHSFGR